MRRAWSPGKRELTSGVERYPDWRSGIMSRTALTFVMLVVVGGCGGGDAATPMGPVASADIVGQFAAALPDASPRSGPLHVTKECSQYTRLAGSFCTITSSNL